MVCVDRTGLSGVHLLSSSLLSSSRELVASPNAEVSKSSGERDSRSPSTNADTSELVFDPFILKYYYSYFIRFYPYIL